MDQLQRHLNDHFGFAAFRPGQAEACAAAVAGRDVLVVMPTGAGKSLCYQLPALVRDDLTVVVSPLVALMQDQLEGLERAAPGRAALVNAQQDPGRNAAALERARAGELKLLYVAPERFSSPGFLDSLRSARVGLFVVDEAHCVSQWGHDFRPDYFRLADAARWLGAKAIVASTATATPEVARDVVARLELRDPVRVTTGFDRPNLSFVVAPCATAADKTARLIAALEDDAARPAIVYAGTRKGAETLAADLERALDIDVVAYHAGLGRAERAEAQRRFMGGEVEVVVATNAFGMGVDKADVRTVAHAVVPPSVEAFYQEAGRAGRDGLPARALLLAEPRDKGLHVFFIERAEVDDALLEDVARRLVMAGADGQYDVALADLHGDAERLRAVIGHLARAGLVQPTPAPTDRARGRITGAWDAASRSAARNSAADGQRARWRQYRGVWAFAEGGECRRAAILRHFGDPSAPAPTVPCCDVCEPAMVPAPQAPPVPDGAGFDAGDLDGAIVAVVASARPAAGRTRVVEILRGGRSQALLRHSYDGLPAYGAFAHLSQKTVLARVDKLLGEGRIESSGGYYPVLRATPALAS